MTPVFDSARENDIGDTFDTARELWQLGGIFRCMVAMPLIAGFGQAVTDIGFVRAIEHGGLHMPAKGLGNIAKVDFQHSAAGGHAVPA